MEQERMLLNTTASGALSVSIVRNGKINGGHFIESDSPVEFESSKPHIRYNGRHMVIKT